MARYAPGRSLSIPPIQRANLFAQGGPKYQSAFYVFEELAQAPSSSSVSSLVAQATAELHLGRIEEAEAALNQAAELGADDAQVLANRVALESVKGSEEWKAALEQLKTVEPKHALVTDLEEKMETFGEGRKKWAQQIKA